MEFFNSLRRQGETDQPTGMSGHEIDGRGCHMLRGHDEIAFILTIFVIDEDDELPALDVPNCVFDAVKRSGHNFNTDGECSMVTVQRTINLSFNIDTFNIVFLRPTVNRETDQEEGPAREAARALNATITVPQAQTPNPAKSQRPRS